MWLWAFALGRAKTLLTPELVLTNFNPFTASPALGYPVSPFGLGPLRSKHLLDSYIYFTRRMLLSESRIVAADGGFFSWGARVPVISRWHSGHRFMSHTGQYSAGALHSSACSPVGSWLSTLDTWQRVCIIISLAWHEPWALSPSLQPARPPTALASWLRPGSS